MVPLALVDPDLAEHTRATRNEGADARYDGTIWFVMPSRNLPTDVPPYFCTIQSVGSWEVEGIAVGEAMGSSFDGRSEDGFGGLDASTEACVGVDMMLAAVQKAR